jgi:hypothetical protein
MTSHENTQIEQLAAERLPYETPILRTIALAAQEVLGSSCKSYDGTGGLGGFCGTTSCATTTGS